MKKIYMAALVLLIGATSAGAQGKLLELGVKGGLTTNAVKFTDDNKVLNGDYGLDGKSRIGFQLGILGRINLAMMHIQPEIMYSQSNFRIAAVSHTAGNATPYKSTVRLKTVDVPILAGLKVMFLRVQAGPMFTVMSETKTKNKSLIQDVMISTPSVSYLLGIGADIGRVNLDVRFNGNFKKSTQSILFNDYNPGTGLDYRSRHKHWMFSVAYLF